MGLYDGAAPRSEEAPRRGREVARRPRHRGRGRRGMARTLAAVAQGSPPSTPRCGSPASSATAVGSRSHLELLREALAPLPVFGGLPRVEALRFPERHLGSSPRPARCWTRTRSPAGARSRRSGWTSTPSSRWRAAPRRCPTSRRRPRARSGAGIGVAQDEAFHFYYDDNLARLEALGARLVRVLRRCATRRSRRSTGSTSAAATRSSTPAPSPPTARCSPGSAPSPRAAGRSTPSAAASCTSAGRSGRSTASTTRGWGSSPGRRRCAIGCRPLGYAEVETTAPTCLGPAGLRLRGHQFRYSDLEGMPADGARAYRVRRRRGGEPFAEGFGGGNVLASWVHVHWASCPEAAEGLVAACERSRGAR